MSVSIALEGSEGAGKSVLFALSANLLRDTVNLPVMFQREPGGTPLGEQIRHILKTDVFKDMHAMTSAYLFSAQRSELFYKVEKPFLEENPQGILLKDRSWLSTQVLQIAEGADPEYIEMLQKPFLSIPQKFAIIDIPVEETIVRMAAAAKYSSDREVDWRDQQTHNILEKYRENYLSFAVKNRDKCIVLDCFDDPWNKAAIIKLEAMSTLAEQEGKSMSEELKSSLLREYTLEAKSLIDEDNEQQVLRVYDINGRREKTEKVRHEMNYTSREELRSKMHEDWIKLGIEELHSGIERGK